MHRWLRQIAFRLYLSGRDASRAVAAALATRREDERVLDLPTPANPTLAGDGPGHRAMHLQRAAMALAKLSERDRDLLLISLDWYDPEERVFRVPVDLIAELCDMYEVSNGNYVQIRHRAFKKVVREFSGIPACVA